ncbi:MAG: sulfotransferase [Rhodospirillaceae bacterium]
MTASLETAFTAGLAALQRRDYGAAVKHFQDVLGFDPHHPAATYNIGALKYQAGQSTEALTYLEQAAVLRPDHLDTLSLLAAVLVDLNRLPQAVPYARTITAHAQSDATTLNTAGRVLALAGWAEEAESAYRKALAQDASYRPAADALVTHLFARRAFTDATDVCDAVLARHPTDQEFHLKRSQALWESGQTAAAWDALQNLLDFAPDHITAHHNLSLIESDAAAAPTFQRLAALIAENTLEAADLIKAWFALGNRFAQHQSYADSLTCFAEGNRLRAHGAHADHARSAAAFEARVEHLLGAPLTPPPAQMGVNHPTPLIISGPSRAGKSLLQSWLSVHPDIAAADEVGLLPRLNDIDFSADPHRLAEAADTYRTTLKRLAGAKGQTAKFVIDTHPTNALYFDILLRLCPDAKIIQIQRDPLDLAVSLYARNYVTGGHWADSWSGIAKRLTCYDRLRYYYATWSPVIATISYEDLVNTPVSQLQSLVEALGLVWTDDLSPPAPDPQDLTPMPWASFADRPPVQTHGIGLWRSYAPWLAEFADAYGRSALKTYGRSALKTYGRDALQEDNAIPAQASHLSMESLEILKKVPAFHARVAAQAETDGHWDAAVSARWRAVSCRPFTHHVRHHAEALQQTLQASPQHTDLAHLHQEIAKLWAAYRETPNMRFGDFGLPYQSFTPAYIAGSRDTDVRAAAYDLEHLTSGRRVLDLGANSGFLTLEAAKFARQTIGVEHAQALVDIGSRVRQFMNLDTCQFLCGDAATFTADEPFDVVIATAVHGWLDLPVPNLARHLAHLTAPGGAVLFESQGQRSTSKIEPGFDATVKAIAQGGFTVERDGTLCDDAVNLRAFVVLRKTL